MSDSAPARVNYDQVTAIVGHVDDEIVARIIETGATADQVLEAFTWFNAEEAIAPNPEHQMTDPVRRVYAILASAQAEEEERRS
jgi:hypothetical protein